MLYGFELFLRKEAEIAMPMKMKLPSPSKAKKFFETKVAFTTGPAELKDLIERHQSVTIVDVRAAEDYEQGHIPGAINVPKGDWASTEALAKDRLNVVYCYTSVCHLAAKACVQFAHKEYPVMEMDGGFEAWKDYGYEIEGGEKRSISEAIEAA